MTASERKMVKRIPRERTNRELLPASVGPARTAVLLLALLGTSIPGCMFFRGKGSSPSKLPEARTAGLDSEGSRADGEERAPRSPFEYTPSLVGKPYEDLRRHTMHALGAIAGIDVSPDGAALLYSSTQDGAAANIYIKRENSPGVTRKTSGRSWDIHPRFSPDGKWIAFASDRDGNFDIWIIPAGAAGGAEQFTSSPEDDLSPTWSPDGRKIALCRRSPDHGWTLWILDRSDQSVVELGPGLLPAWSPTGEWIAFQKPSEREPHWFGLWIIRPDGSEVRQVVAGDGFGAMAPSWSPEGHSIAFSAVRQGTGDIRQVVRGDVWVTKLSSGKMYRITSGPGTEATPVWGLGGRIYFASDRRDGAGIWSLLPPEVEG